MTSSKPGPRPNPESKRNSDGWVPVTAFLTPATRSRLQDAIHRLKLSGIQSPADQSEVLELAVTAWLDQCEPLLTQVMAAQEWRAANPVKQRFFHPRKQEGRN